MKISTSILVLWVVATTWWVEGTQAEPTTVTLINEEAYLEINDKHLQLRLYYSGAKVFDEPIGSLIPLSGSPNWTTSGAEFCAVWTNGVTLKISALTDGASGVRVAWTAPPASDYIQECFDLHRDNWYGGAELHTQPWPIQNQSFQLTPFIPNAQNGGVLERYFLSHDHAYYLDRNQPLFVSLSSAPENKTLCFYTSYVPPYINTNGREVHMAYTIMLGSDLVNIHRAIINSFFALPSGIPSEKVFRLPIWSTWATYKQFVNQTKVIQFANDIRSHGFPACQIEVDDSWEAGDAYGVEVFDAGKFPNPVGMVNSLKLMGFDLTLWVHPFVNVNSSTFDEGDELGYFVKRRVDNATGIAVWWDGDAGVIDVTRMEAADWWARRLDQLKQDVGVASFKFDAGESQFLPVDGYYNSDEDLQPGIYSTEYVKFASRYGGQIEVRDGYGTQNVPSLVRILDRSSTWSLSNGLRSVITSSLHLGIVGYPFVLPDMIGGNGYGVYPTRELFIRWVQVNAFLPTMQFSYPPWIFDQEVTNISLRMVELHRNISDVIVAAAQQATVDGTPIIRPLWWISANDTTAQVINDEFLVGDEYLVAPILAAEATWRHIYLPEGNWRDEMNGQEVAGPVWLQNYQVPLDQIPYFSNLDN